MPYRQDLRDNVYWQCNLPLNPHKRPGSYTSILLSEHLPVGLLVVLALDEEDEEKEGWVPPWEAGGGGGVGEGKEYILHIENYNETL